MVVLSVYSEAIIVIDYSIEQSEGIIKDKIQNNGLRD